MHVAAEVEVAQVVLGAARIVAVARGTTDGAFLTRALDVLDRAEPAYLFLCATAAVAVLIRGFGEITSWTNLLGATTSYGTSLKPIHDVGYRMSRTVCGGDGFGWQWTDRTKHEAGGTFVEAEPQHDRFSFTEMLVLIGLVIVGFSFDHDPTAPVPDDDHAHPAPAVKED